MGRSRGRIDSEPEGQHTRPVPSRARRLLFWTAYAILFAVVLTVLAFPYDRVVKHVIVSIAGSNGIMLEFDSFDHRFPARIVCRGMTVASSGDGILGSGIRWREFECDVALRPLIGRCIDMQHFRGVLDSGSDTEGVYTIEGSAAIDAAGASSAGQVVRIRGLTLRGQGVNLSVSGDVTMARSIREIGIDLSVDVEQLDRLTSANTLLDKVFLGLKFAMGSDKPPICITMQGQGADTEVVKKPLKRAL